MQVEKSRYAESGIQSGVSAGFGRIVMVDVRLPVRPIPPNYHLKMHETPCIDRLGSYLYLKPRFSICREIRQNSNSITAITCTEMIPYTGCN